MSVSEPSTPCLRACPPEDRRLGDLRVRLDGLRATLGLAQALGANGERIDLSGLEDVVGQLCAAVLDLTPSDGRALRADMILLERQLRELGATVRAHPPPWSRP